MPEAKIECWVCGNEHEIKNEAQIGITTEYTGNTTRDVIGLVYKSLDLNKDFENGLTTESKIAVLELIIKQLEEEVHSVALRA